jgi:DNA (cytosine-5)-methyltransferase 1
MRSLELFAGCGGLALGVAKAGFKHDIVIEMDADAVNTLNDNKKRKLDFVRHWQIGQLDTRHVDFSGLSGVDLLSGGPPCQPFSIGGRHLGPRDPRNMWPEAIRAVQELRPKAFIFENVRGLFRPDFSDYLDYIKLQLSYPDLVRRDEPWRTHLARLRKHSKSKAGRKGEYRVLAQAINAADYGAPQKRHRAIFIGIASRFGDQWEFPQATHSQDALIWSKHIEKDYWTRHGARRVSDPSSEAEKLRLDRLSETEEKPITLPWVTVRDAIGDLPPPTKRE